MQLQPFVNQTFLFTGTLSKYTRVEAESIVKKNGGKVKTIVTPDLTYIVVGSNADYKLQKAIDLGTVIVLSENEFMELLRDTSTSETHKSKNSIDAYEREQEQGHQEDDPIEAKIVAGVSEFNEYVESLDQPSAGLLLTAIVLIDIMMHNNTLADDTFYVNFTRFLGWVHGRAYGWDEIDDDGYLGYPVMEKIRGRCQAVAQGYLQSAGTIAFSSYLQSIGAAGMDAKLRPDEKGDLGTYLLTFRHAVFLLHKECYSGVDRDVAATLEQIDCTEIVDELSEAGIAYGEAFVDRFSDMD